MLSTSSYELSVEEVCDLLESDRAVECINAVDDDIYFIGEHILYRYDTVSNSLTVSYDGEIEVKYYIPTEYGVVIGTELPTSNDGTVHTSLEYEDGLEWPGDYYFYNNATGELTALDDPDWSLLVYSAKTVSPASYTTTINGKSIPSSAYPVDSTYSDSDNSSVGTQCQGFATGIIKYLYGAYNNVDTYYFNSTLTAEQIKAYGPGSLIRANVNDHKHSMILIGSDTGGIYVYHANWGGNNVISISYVPNDDFSSGGTFYSIDYIMKHNHSYSNISYSTSQHKKSCACGAYITEFHTLSNWTNYNSAQHIRSCSQCGYSISASHSISS